MSEVLSAQIQLVPPNFLGENLAGMLAAQTICILEGSVIRTDGQAVSILKGRTASPRLKVNEGLSQ